MGARRVWGSAAVALVMCTGWTAAVSAESPQITDMEADAYRYPATPLGQPGTKPPNPVMSNDAADMLSVTFSERPPRQPAHDSGYSVSVTVSGAPHETYNYLVGARFGDAARECYVIHFLKAGEARDALVNCYEGEKVRTIGTITGSMVSIKGSTISASFSFRRVALPPALKADPALRQLYAMSCPVTSKAWGCNDDVIDWGFANSATTFAI